MLFETYTDVRFTIRALSLFADVEEADVILAAHISHKTKLGIIKKQLITFFRDLVQAVDIDSGAVRVALVTFGSDTKIQFSFDQFLKTKKLQKGLRSIKATQYRSKTADYLQLLNSLETDLLTKEKGDRDGVPNLIIVVNDIETHATSEILQATARLAQKDTTLVAIGVEKASETELAGLTRNFVEGYYFKGDKYDDLTKSAELREELTKRFKIRKFTTTIKDHLR